MGAIHQVERPISRPFQVLRVVVSERTSPPEPTAAPAPTGVRREARAFDGWSARPRATADDMARRSKAVRRLRRGVLFVALALVASWVTAIGLNSANVDFTRQFTGLDRTEDGLAMRSPRFSGRDAEGRAFEVVAATATQPRTDDKALLLENPTAKSGVGAPDMLSVRAQSGLYATDDRTLELSGGVLLSRGRGSDLIAFTAPSARLLLNEHALITEDGVTGAGPMGLLSAQALRADEETGRIVLNGDVRVRLYTGEKKEQ